MTHASTHASDQSTLSEPHRFPVGSLDPARPSLVRGLSDREAVIAVMVAGGHTCERVASDLVLPLRTVQGHLYQVLTILGLSTMEELTFDALASRSDTRRAATARKSRTLIDPPGTTSISDQDPEMHIALTRELAATRALLQQKIEKLQQFQQAISSRDAIGQAKGILMERHKISAKRAFTVLQDESIRTNRKLIDVAEQLVHSGHHGTGNPSRRPPHPERHA